MYNTIKDKRVSIWNIHEYNFDWHRCRNYKRSTAVAVTRRAFFGHTSWWCVRVFVCLCMHHHSIAHDIEFLTIFFSCFVCVFFFNLWALTKELVLHTFTIYYIPYCVYNCNLSASVCRYIKILDINFTRALLFNSLFFHVGLNVAILLLFNNSFWVLRMNRTLSIHQKCPCPI